MNPQLTYQAAMARIDDLHLEAEKRRIAACAGDGRRQAGSRRRLRLPRLGLRLPARERLA